jgi:Uncharacterized protein conserved in bacteria
MTGRAKCAWFPLALPENLPHVRAIPNRPMNPTIFRFLSLTALAVLALALGACETTKPAGPRNSFTFDPPVQKPKNPAAVKVKLSTGAQRLYVVEGDTVLLATPVTVGKASSPTPHGTFPIQAKVEQRRRVSSPGSGYPMTYWMQFYSPAYGMHWGFIKPYPSTHGCVRIPLKAAKKVFALVRVGTPVHVATSQPWDATIGKSLPTLDDSRLPDPPMSYMLSPKVFSDAREGKMWNF